MSWSNSLSPFMSLRGGADGPPISTSSGASDDTMRDRVKSDQEFEMKTSAVRKVGRVKGTHFEVAKRLGLVGCLAGPPDLAQHRRKYVRRALGAKYRPR